MLRAVAAAILIAIVLVVLIRAPWRVEMCGEVEAVVVRSQVSARVSATGRAMPTIAAAHRIETAEGRSYAMGGLIEELAPGTRVRAALSCEPPGGRGPAAHFIAVLDTEDAG
jgi:hypothetical protein